MRNNAQNYLNANPQVQTDLQGIRQPLVDFKGRCQ
jgi:Haemophore, haem-binding